MTRYINDSTTRNLDAFLVLLAHPTTHRIVLYASPSHRTKDMSSLDGAPTNLPLLAARAEVVLPVVGAQEVIFDGLFLTCARRPRYQEVRTLLDAAVASGKVEWAMEPVRFTAGFTPVAAALVMRNTGPLAALTPDTRAGFFAMLSSMSETWLQTEHQ